MWRIFGVVLLLGSSLVAFAQADLADDLFDNLEFKQAAIHYQKAESLSQNQKEKYAFALLQIHDYITAEKIYEEVVKVEDVDPVHYYYYAISLKNNKKYDLAKGYFDLSKAFNPIDYYSDLNIQSMDSLPYFDKNNLPLVTSAKKSFNSPIAEFSPHTYKEGVLFTKEIKYDESKKRPHIDFSSTYSDTSSLQFGTSERPLTVLYYMAIKDNEFQEPQLMALSDKYHIGSFAIHPKTGEIYFTKIDLINNWYPDARSFPRLFKGTLNPEEKTIENVEKVKIKKLSNEVGSGHPAFSKNGDLLYFASDMPGGKGGSDIYVVKLDGESWGEPLNISSINTPGDEVFPVVLGDSFYYSSDGRIGYGGLDVFKVEFEGSDTTIKSIQLVGKPINSPADDFGLLYLENPDNGIIVSNRFGGVGDDDLFYFEPALIEPEVAGIVSDLEGNPMPFVTVVLFDEEGNEIAKTQTNGKGEYVFADLEKDKTYTIVALENGMADQEVFTTDENWKNQLNLILEPTLTAQGLVQTEDGEAAPGATIVLLDENGDIVFSGLTDENGMYQFMLDSNNTYTIVAEKGNLKGIEKLVVNEDYNSSENKDIVLKAAETFVNGTIKNENGDAQSGVEVNLYDKDGKVISTEKSGNDGKFHFDLDRNTNYQIEANNNDYEGVENIFTGENWDTDREIDITLKPKGNPGSGIVTDNATKKPIDKVKITLTDNESGIKKVVYTNKEGLFNLRFSRDKEYTISLQKDGYFPKTITLEKTHRLPKEIDLNLEQDLSLTQSGFTAQGVYFEFDKYNLTPSAKSYLDQVISRLKSDENLKVIVKSYADCRGRSTYNRSLSWKRSRSVKQYLIANGIAEKRILTVSMGATNFVNNCYKPEMCSEAEHAMNRRSEIEVTP